MCLEGSVSFSFCLAQRLLGGFLKAFCFGLAFQQAFGFCLARVEAFGELFASAWLFSRRSGSAWLGSLFGLWLGSSKRVHCFVHRERVELVPRLELLVVASCSWFVL